MKRIALSLLAIPVALCAQTIINGGRIIKGELDASGSTRTLPHRAGTGSPVGRDNCQAAGETYFQTDATPGQNLWVCTAAGTPGTWNEVSGGSGGSSFAPASTTVTYSATPTFGVTASIQEFTITLAGNVTSSTLSGAAAGDILIFNICQNATGGYTFIWPTGFSAASAISTTASTCTPEIFTWNGSSATLVATKGGSGGGGLTSVGLTMPSAFTVTGSPLTANGSLGVTGAGTSAQYITGAGALATFPTTWSATSLTGMVPATQIPAALSSTTSVNGTAIPASSTLLTTASGEAVNSAEVAGITVSGTPSSGQVLTATSSTAANWQTPSSGGGGNASITATALGNQSGSVTLTRSSNIQEWTMTLTGNVTFSSTITNAANGDVYVFDICQNATGGYSVAWPNGFPTITVDPNANACTYFQGAWNTTTTTFQLTGAPESNEQQFLLSGAAERAAPTSAPPGSYAELWPDSTRHTWASMDNNSTNKHIMPRTAGTSDQLASTDLSDTANLAYLSAANNTFAGTLTLSTISGSTQCLQANSSGVISGTGSACGSGSGGGANANGSYVVTQSTNEPANAVNLGALASGVLTQTVSSGAATLSVATSSTQFPGNAATATALAATPTQCSGGQVPTGITATGAANGCFTPSGSGSSAFSSITTGTNTAAVMTVGSGASIAPSGTGTVTATGIASGSTNPLACTVGQTFFNTAAASGSNLYLCTAANTWTQVSAGSSTITENLYVPFNAQYSTSTGASTALGSGLVRDTNDNSGSTPYVIPGAGYGWGGFQFYNSTSTHPSNPDYIYYTAMLHQTWTGPINVILQAVEAQTSQFGNAYLKVAAACGTVEGVTFNADSTGYINYATSTQEYKPLTLTLSGINTTGCSAGGTIVFRIGRDATTATGLDTLGASIIVLGMQIQYQHN